MRRIRRTAIRNHSSKIAFCTPLGPGVNRQQLDLAFPGVARPMGPFECFHKGVAFVIRARPRGCRSPH